MNQTTDEQQVSEDDWAAAMNEQTVAAAPGAAAQPARIFEQFSEGESPSATPRKLIPMWGPKVGFSFATKGDFRCGNRSIERATLA